MNNAEKFRLWVKKYHKLGLRKWQMKVVELLFSMYDGAGKTTLIQLLIIYDKNENNIDNEGNVLV